MSRGPPLQVREAFSFEQNRALMNREGFLLVQRGWPPRGVLALSNTLCKKDAFWEKHIVGENLTGVM